MFIKLLKNSIFLLSLIFASGAALAAPDMNLGGVSGLAGSNVTLPITFTNGTGNNAASGMTVQVNYDNTKLTFVQGTQAGLNADQFSVTAAGNVLTISGLNLTIPLPSTAFTSGAINLQFTIIPSATGNAAVSLQTPGPTTFQNTFGTPIAASDISFTSGTGVTITPPNTAGAVNITGNTQVGQTLTANVADANGTTGVTIAYQWSANGVAIAGATAMTYTLTSNELGKTITVQATYTDQNGYAENPTSSATAAITPTTTPIVGVATITGTPQVGQTLTANVTDANGITGTISYQWLANGAAITGATTATYVPTTDDVGKVLTVQATYTDQISTNETPVSPPTAAVTSAPVTTSNPANIPVFGPFGLLAVLAGLFWFGGRRNKH